jgi:sarcosine oxidase subunit gamma
MSALALESLEHRERLGLKGPGAAQWLAANGIEMPMAPNTWTHSAQAPAAEALLVARLGATEFFLEEGAAGTTLKRIASSLHEHSRGGLPRDGLPPGVYPVMREDSAFLLGGGRAHDVLAQVCNVNFAALPLDSRPLIMTLMIGVAVLVVPQRTGEGAASERPGAEERQYRIWCDPTFGPYLGASLGGVVIECGGRYMGASE